MDRYVTYHRTEYEYSLPVNLGPHRLIVRPREGHELRLLSSQITTWPLANLAWSQDVFGNAVATATFTESTKSLVIESKTVLELGSVAWPVFQIAASASQYPFSYSADERADLGALLSPQYPDPMGRLSSWAASFVRGNPTDTLSLLKDINAGISGSASYQVREAEGIQSPTETLDLGKGTCRDFALLFAETVRTLGFGARLVSGYLFNPTQLDVAGTTHAWADVFVPGAGWISFDPTNQKMGSFNLIPVAVARDLPQITPVAGIFSSSTGADSWPRLSVDVRVNKVT